MTDNRASMTRTKNLASGQLLDTTFAPEISNQTAYELGEILTARCKMPNPKMCDFQDLAADLSTLAKREQPWTKKYVHSVFKEYFAASPDFAATVSKLAQVVGGEKTGVAGTAYVSVLADPRAIPDGTLIPASAVVLKCARPGCDVKFVRLHPRQKYHDPKCK